MHIDTYLHAHIVIDIHAVSLADVSPSSAPRSFAHVFLMFFADAEKSENPRV